MILAFLLFPLLSFAHILQDDVAVTDKIRHSFKAVCLKMVTHEAPLIEIVSGTQLDCMGKKINVADFCEKELVTDPYYLRAYIDKTTSEVVCVSGKKVLFKYQCVKLSDMKLCSQEAKTSCQFIQEKLAKRLDLIHASIVKNEKGIKQLNCFFESLPLSEKSNGL
jgi:DNA-binding XRE family transcriptional regulator